jgi:hypothetical protein
MAITTIDGLTAALPAFGWPVLKTPFTTQAASAWNALWTVTGIPGAGVNTSAGVNGEIPTDATAGAYPFTNPTSPALSYLSRFYAYASSLGQLFLYDRLWHNSGLSVTTTGNQSVTSTTLTRPDSTGFDVEAWLEVYTALGAGSTAKTIDYTDQDGNTSNTGTLQGFVTTAAAGRAFPFSLASGDTGVRQITGFDNVATSTSGTFGLVLRRFVSMVSISVNASGAAIGPIDLGLPRVYDDACLDFLWLCSAAGNHTVGGNIAIAQG